jgi:hypothetical protein
MRSTLLICLAAVCLAACATTQPVATSGVQRPPATDEFNCPGGAVTGSRVGSQPEICVSIQPVPPPSAGAPSPIADPTEVAIWVPRKLAHFTHPPQIVSCDALYEETSLVLKELGARPSDLVVDQRDCHVHWAYQSVDATFAVLVPADMTAKDAADTLVKAHWRLVRMTGDCQFLEYITEKLLPLFAARNVSEMSIEDCARNGGIGLRAEMLMPLQRPR